MSEAVDAEVERWTREVRKGSTRLAILALIEERESYGYELLGRLEDRGTAAVSTTEATVYPLLHDLEERGFLDSDWKTTEEGVPPRKYYDLTDSGRELLAALRDAWVSYRDEMDAIVEG